MTATLERTQPLATSTAPSDGSESPGGDTRRHGPLDGVRGLALALVVIFHAGWLPGGFIAVDVFFVLSGYLITRQLVRMIERRGRLPLGQFWLRRAKRLGPAAVVLLGAAYLWMVTRAPASAVGTIKGQLEAGLTWTSNWYAVFHRLGYWQADATKTPLTHLWSLAIEEQFYVVWPLALLGILLLTRRSLRASAVLVAVLAAAALSWNVIAAALLGADRAYYGSDTRVGPLLCGAGLALALAGSGASPDGTRGRQRRAVAVLVALVFTGLLVLACARWSTEGGAYFRGGLAAISVATAALLWSLERGAGGWGATLLGRGPLPWLGVRSYSLYLWTWPAWLLIDEPLVHLHGAPLNALRIAAGLVAGWLSFVLVERPIHRSKLQGPTVAILLLAPLLWLGHTVHRFEPASPPEFGSQPITTEPARPGNGLRLLIVGDSWARNLGRAVVDADQGEDAVFNDGVGGCGIADAKLLRSEYGDKPPLEICSSWPSRWADDVRRAEPDAVVLETGNWDQLPVKLSDRFVSPGDREFDAHYARQLDRAVEVLSAQGATVFVMTVRDHPTDRRLSAAMNRLLTDAVGRHAGRARLLDLRSQICDSAGRCPERIKGVPVYDHTGHLAAGAQRRVAAWVLDSLRAQVRPVRGLSDAKVMEPADLLVRLLGSGATANRDGDSASVLDDVIADLAVAPATAVRRALDAGALRLSGSNGRGYAAMVRFADDATPDSATTPALVHLRADGWHESADNTFARHVFSNSSGTAGEHQVIGILRTRLRLMLISLTTTADITRAERTVTRYLETLERRDR